jgi:hypothetical protein
MQESDERETTADPRLLWPLRVVLGPTTITPLAFEPHSR